MIKRIWECIKAEANRPMIGEPFGMDPEYYRRSSDRARMDDLEDRLKALEDMMDFDVTFHVKQQWGDRDSYRPLPSFHYP